jgi:hypothetical protein
MVTFELRGVNFSDSMSSAGKMAIVDPSGIGVEVHETKRFEQLLQVGKHLIRATAEYLCQDYPSQMIDRLPQPALTCFALHETPPLIHLCRFDSANLYRDRVGTAPFHDCFVHRRERPGLFFNSSITVMGLICSTRAISRTPLPLRVMATICRFTSGNRPGYA